MNPMTNSTKFDPKRILCPVDYSEPSALALKYAVAGARVFDADLTVLHAVQIEPPPYFTKSETDQLLDQLRQALEYARADLTAFITRVLGKDPKLLNIQIQVSDALAAAAILEAIKNDQADLVIMGTHGRSPAKRFLLGSVTETVLQQSPVPVFIVRQAQHALINVEDPNTLPIVKRILCPVNSPHSSAAGLGHAANLAAKFGAQLTILYVAESETEPLDKAHQKLCSWIPAEVPATCSISHVIRKGVAGDEIIRFAGETQQDMIVLCAYRGKETKERIFGQTADLVLRKAPVPVLVVPVHANLDPR